ncbi:MULTISPECIES: HGxxPAAW family protein [Streptomyces]|uniref:HGxxPAAW family protein n=1 Tax=Streptomyces solicathayae TaxID=3081768 RepID=A0ABZ0M1J3_9ACTN|nr:HGxxPAAW family protein [Streptomyces sp. HUAS YS2]WOX24929.1 HGxxPAAW family protein [Streptomyces sp. HUAS YS2]
MAGSAHGHTLAAWTGVTISFIGFCVASVFMVAANVPGFWAGAALILLGAVVGGVMKMMGLGTPKESEASIAARARAAAAVQAR